jgi:hypothetical protein
VASIVEMSAPVASTTLPKPTPPSIPAPSPTTGGRTPRGGGTSQRSPRTAKATPSVALAPQGSHVYHIYIISYSYKPFIIANINIWLYKWQ